jgi:hypothetical protein
MSSERPLKLMVDYAVKDLDQLQYFLDTEVKQEKGGILLSQRRYYAIDLLKKATHGKVKSNFCSHDDSTENYSQTGEQLKQFKQRSIIVGGLEP